MIIILLYGRITEINIVRGKIMNIFDVINIYGLIFTIILIVPHIVFVKTQSYDLSVIENRGMFYIERTGKYCSAFLMFVNIGVLEEGFTSEYMRTFWLISTTVLCLIYIVLWIMFFKKESKKATAYAITVVSAIIIIMSGLLQVKTLLLTAGIVYLIGEIYLCKKIF